MSYTAMAHLPVSHGVTNLTTGCLNSREYGNPGVHIFTGCVNFYDTGLDPEARARPLSVNACANFNVKVLLGLTAYLI